MNERQRILLLAFLEFLFILGVMAFLDAYICVHLFGSGTPKADFSRIMVWWDVSLAALIASSVMVAIAALLGDWGEWSREDWVGFALLILSPLIFIFFGLFDLASGMWHFILWGQSPLGVLGWLEWPWLDAHPLLGLIARLFGHAHVLLSDLLIACILGAGISIAAWVMYLKES